jgi:glycosyltransferase involved in cell wall biosynthesis
LSKIVKLLSQSYLSNQGRYPRITSEAKSLLEQGHSIIIFGWDRKGNCPESEISDNIQIKRVKVKSKEMRGPLQILFLVVFWVKAFIKLLDKEINIIHCHNLDVMPLGYVLSKLKGCRLIYDAHEPNYYALWPKRWHFLLKLIDWVEIFLARRADTVIVANSYQIEKFRSNGINHIRIIGNYPAREFIVHTPKGNLDNKGLIFGRIGTIYPDIGLEEVCSAMKEIVKKYPDTQLFLAGRVVDSYKPQFEKILKELKGYVEYAGPYRAEEMPSLYKKIDVSLLVYRRNAWFSNITPTKFYDSLANGVPVIMTDIGRLGSVIEKNRCGIVVDEKDINTIIKAMERFISNPALIIEMGKNGLRLIKNEYNWDLMAKELKELYATL